MTAAIFAARAGKEVLLLEKGEETGRKILSTGNGRCNLSNRRLDENCYHTKDPAFVGQVLSCFGGKELRAYMEEIGIIVTEERGFLYPLSFQASAVRDALSSACRESGVKLRTGCRVREIRVNDIRVNDIRVNEEPQGGAGKDLALQSLRVRAAGKKSRPHPKAFEVRAETGDGEEELFLADRCVLAAGGMAAPKTGSDGDSYLLAERLGHGISVPLPALVPLEGSSPLCKKLAGVRVQALLRLFLSGQEADRAEGELQCVDYGLSGFPLFQLSGPAVRGLKEGKQAEISVSFLPELEEKELLEIILKGIERFPERSLSELLHGLLPWKVAEAFLPAAGLPEKLKGAEAAANFKKLEELVRLLKDWRVPITGDKGFDRAQTTSGGIKTGEIDPVTMMSRIIPGFYLAGECVDVDGLCGGYNLHWAFATGAAAGKAAGRDME